MQVLFVAPYVPSLIRVRPFQFIRELANQGHQVTLLAAATRGSDAESSAIRAYTSRLEVVRISLAAALRSCLGAALRGDPLQAAVSQAPELDERLHLLLAQDRFDIVHIEHLRAARLVRLLPPHLARLYDAVDSISLLLRRTLRASHSLRQRAIAVLELQRTRAFEGRILAGFDETIVTSPDDAEVLCGLAPTASLRVVPNGVDQVYFQPLAEPREPATLVFSGKMSYHANATAVLDFVRSIFPLIRAARPDVRLTIVGSSPPPEVRQLAQDPAITVTGLVADLRPYVGRATVAVCPMVVKVGIQNKLLEAMAMATPTVATRIGAVGLSARHGQDLLVADDARQFAEHVCGLLADPVWAASVGRAGRAYVQQHHSWKRATETLVILYAQAREKRAKLVRSS